jgi:hypothetical protein
VVSRNAADSAEVGFFKITGIANGTLFQNDGVTAINNGDFITFAQANAGLKFTAVADFFGNGTFDVQASTSNTNAGLGGSVQTATITVLAVNDAPSLSATGNNFTYAPAGVDLFSGVTTSTGPANESAQNIKQLVLTVSNVEGTGSDEKLTIDGTDVFLTDTNTAVGANHAVNISVALSGGTATVTIFKTAGDIPAADVASIVDGLTYTNNNVTAGETARNVTITSIQDSGGTSPGVDTSTPNIVSTVNFNVAPTIVAGGTLNYTENDAATLIDSTIDITDPDNPNMVSAKVAITGGFDNTQDILSFTPSGGIGGSYNASTGELTLTGTASQAAYETVLGTVKYQNTSDNPTTAQRTVSYTVNDGMVDSAAGTATINVTAVNDVPVVTAGHTLNYTENQAATAFDPAITVSDLDNANLASATVQITGNYVNGQDVLGFTTQNGITGVFSAGTGTMTLNGSSSVANYQTALASVTYVNTSENPSGLARTVTIITNDGTANSVAKTGTINVTPVNDAPVTAAGGTLNYTENQVATAIDATVTVSDADNANLSGATVQLTTNYVNGQDILGFTTQNGITGVFSAASGTMTLSGSSSVANYQTALRSVTYFDNSDNPSGLDRTVVYTANDGAGNGNSSTSTIHVTPVNDAPVVTATGTLAYTENQAATAIAPALTVTDADTGTLTTATVTISANYVNGEDVLAFTTQNGITGSFDAPSGTMTLSGTASVANYQTAMESVTYVNTSENPSTAARTVTFNADDGQGVNHLSAGSNHTITVASVDDAPLNNGVPANFIAQSGFAHTITGLSIADVDAGANDITTTFTAAAGTVSIGNGASGGTAGISGGATITTNASGTVVLTGTVAEINTSLSGNNVAYTAADNVTTPTTTTLSMATNDLGHTGTGGPITDTDIIAVGVIPQVWFIDSTPTSVDSNAPLGSQANPFASVHDFNASSGPGANDYIYVKEGTYDGEGINLKAGQTLLGDDQALSFTNPLPGGGTIVIEDATGARPIISVNAANATDQGIALASGNTVAGINVVTNAAGQTGIDDSGASVGTLNISAADVTGSGQAINITHGSAATGGSMSFGTVSSSGGTNGIALGGTLTTTFSAATGTLSGHSGSEFLINGGSGTVSYAGTIGDGSGLSASIASRTGGTVTLSGNINDGVDVGGGISVSSNTGGTIDFTGATKTLNTVTGNAVSMSSNGGATVNFSNGGLDIDTTSGTGFSASVAGTYSVTGSGNTINTTSGTALNLAFVTVGTNGITFNSATTTSAATGISMNTIDQAAGSTGIDINGGSIAGATTRGVDINATSADISIASSIATTAAGRSVEVTSTTGNKTIAFSGAIDDNGQGINLATNTGTTMNFTGGLQIDSAGANNGFVATGGGTVNVTGSSNHIATGSGTALNISNTTIGGSHVIFHDINSNGAANGIILNNTGASGHLAVTGDGSSAVNGTNSSGGQILNSTVGISLNSTTGPTFTNMLIQNSTGSGVSGTGVHGFTFNNGKIDNSGTGLAADTSNIAFNSVSSGIDNIDGAVTINGNVLSNAFYHGVDIYDESGTISNLIITNNTLTSSTSTASSKGVGIRVQANGSASGAAAVTTGSISSNSVFNFPSDSGIKILGGNAGGATQAILGDPASGSNIITINGNHVNGASSAAPLGSNAIEVAMTGNGKANFAITNNGTAGNPLQHFKGIGIVASGGNNAVDKFLIDNNFIDGGDNIFSSRGIATGAQIGIGQTGTVTATVTNNTVNNTDGSGIFAAITNSNNTGIFKIDNNTVGAPRSADTVGIRVESGSASGNTTVNLEMTGNTTLGSGDAPGIGVRKQGTNAAVNVFGIEGFGAGNHTPNEVEDLLGTLNPNSELSSNNFTNSGTRNAKAIVFNGDNFVSATVPLLAAGGGVQAASPTAGEMHLTQAQLDSVVAAAIGQWALAGASASQLAALHATTFSVADLAGSAIGELAQGHITIDADAATHGWFIDPTPNDNSEFTHAANAAGTDLYTDSTNAAAGHLDLLTTVTHELGHVLGLDDSTSASDANNLMYISLVDGERRLPDASDVAHANDTTVAQSIEAALPLSAQAAAGTPIVIGTPANDTIDAGHGGAILFGGAGADNFVFGPGIQLNAPTPAQVTHVADYSAAQGDTFDFSAITSAFHNSSVSDSLVVRAVEDASGKFATLQVDHIDPMGMPSAPNWVNVAQLDGAHAGDAVNILIDNHSVHLAQIHVDLLV